MQLVALNQHLRPVSYTHLDVYKRQSLNRLFEMLRDVLAETRPELGDLTPVYREFRPGDVRHSQANIAKARSLLGYAPTHRLEDGIRVAMPWYMSRFTESAYCGV